MENLLKKTKGFCPCCLNIVEAEIFEKEGNVFIKKTCPRDGNFEIPYFWRDPDYYQTMQSLYGSDQKGDPIARLIYLNRECNQHCNFCFTGAIDDGKGMDAPQDIGHILDGLANFKGQYVYLCGGEPTLRKDLSKIIHSIKKQGFTVVLMSNGKKLTNPDFVAQLAKAGLDTVQLQFDTLDDRQYSVLRNEPLLNIKLKVLDNLRKAKISVQLWVMLVKGINTDQIEPIMRFTARNSDLIKTIFFIPAWQMGRFISSPELTKENILAVIEHQLGITRNDFIAYTKFDYYVSKIYYGLMNRAINRSSSCNLDCHFFVNGDSPIPISRIIDLDAINNSLKDVYAAMAPGTPLNKIRTLSKLPFALFIKQLLLNKKLIAFSAGILFSCLNSFFRGRYPLNRCNHSFHLRIGSFVSVANSDFDIFRHCNISSDDTGTVRSFCLNEIMKKNKGA